MRLRSNAPAAAAPTRRRDRFWLLTAGGAVFVTVLFFVTPALGVFTVPTANEPVASHEFGTPAAVEAPTGLGCTWTNTAANPTSVQLDWTNGQAWSTTQIERNVNGGSYSDSGSPAAAAATSITNTSVTSPASNQYGFKAKGVIGNWSSASTSAVTDETCKGAINELFDGSTNSRLNNPHDVAFDSFGNMFIADTNNHRIRCVAASGSTRCGATAGNIYTVVNTAGTSGTTDGGAATSGKLNSPRGVWIDRHDNLLIADTSNGAIRIVPYTTMTIYGTNSLTAANIYTVAGTIGSTGYGGDGATAVGGTVRLNPADIATDSLDNLYIADGSNHRIRCVAETTKCGASDGFIYTFAGNGTSGWLADGGSPTGTRVATPTGITVNSDGNVIWTDRTSGRLRMVYSNAGETYGISSPSTGNIYSISSDASSPWGIAVDSWNNLIVGDSGTNYVKVFFTSTTTRYGVTPSDNSYTIVAGSGGGTYNGTGLPITGSTGGAIGSAYGVAANPANSADIYAVDNARGVVRRMDYSNGFMFTWAGTAGTSTYVADDVPAHGWEFVSLNHSTLDSSGNVYFADSGDNRIRKWIGDPCYCLVIAAGTGSTTSNGDGSSPLLAGINAPQGVHIDGSGNMYIAESGAHKIRMVPASNMTRFTQVMTAGNIYTIMGNGNQCGAGSAPCGDGGLISSANRLNTPRDVIVDSSGNLIVSDGLNCEIRFVPISTATFFGSARTLNTIYRLGGTQLSCGSAGDGGSATAPGVLINVPDGITLDGSGNLLIAEASGVKIRAISASTGNISAYAGTGTVCGSNDAVVGSATFCNPRDVSYNSTSGAVYVADTGNDLVRKISGGSVTTLAGGGSADPGDTGPGRGAVLIDPLGATAKPSGDLYITQNGAVDQRVIVGADP